MPVRITYHETPPAHPKVGDCWPAPWMLEGEHADEYQNRYLSPKYKREHMGRRPPLIVKLLDGTEFCVDSMSFKDGEPYGDGWTVIGEPPLITVTPSINIVGSYHGFIASGVISDDVEGRKFNA
jgi:hypothetical protein